MLAPVDITDICIETERLIIRPWRESDLVDLYEYASVDGVGQMAGWAPHKSIEVSRMILDMFIREKKTFALELKEHNKVIGSLGLEELRPDPVANGYGREIGYVLSKDYWGRGLMPEAVNAVIEYCFNVLKYDYLTCSHFLRNDRSRRVIEKTGFEYYGESGFETQLGHTEFSRNYILYNKR
ncbi:MAG: GNAT family N-acetyltransferase [Oscillospiraceae bacterium]|nr:GNAT family N-acetyltransferase [Oscillospiraceae bacterium]